MTTKLISFAAITMAALGVSGARLASQEPVPEVFAPGVISGPANDLSPAFSPDGRTVFFTRANSSQSTIVVSHLSGGKWSKPQIAPFSGEWRDLEAAMAPDGSYLIFASNRPAVDGSPPLDGHYNGGVQTAGGGNLWRVDRTRDGWSAPHRLPDVVNSNPSVFSPAVAADGSVYFMQPAGTHARFHIFRAQFSHGAFSAPVAVSISAGEEVGDFDPAVAPDESFMVFSSGRIAQNGTSLFIAFHSDGQWGAPAYLGSAVSMPGTNNIEARLGSDHRTLYFSSTRVVPTRPRDRTESQRGLELMGIWNDGLANIWSVSLDHWLRPEARR